jgi:hypothetical protein
MGVTNHLHVAYPFPTVDPAWGTYGAFHGDMIPGLMNGSVAHVSARNLSDQTSFTFHFRMGIEIQLDPSSTLTPQLKLSPPYDPLALDTYFAIARELKDAYPADYNTTGKLGGAIKEALKALGPPLLAMIPGGASLAPLVGPTVDGLSAIVQENRARRAQRRKGRRAVPVNPVMQTEWETAPESPQSREMRLAAEAALAKKFTTELSQAGIERARERRGLPQQSLTALPRRPRRSRRAKRGTQ